MQNQALLAKLKTGDQQAFRQVVSDFGSKVMNTALGMLQNEQNAEDVSQEVFVEIYSSIHSFRGECSLSSWIYRITVRKSLEYLRNAGRKKRSGLLLAIAGREEQENPRSFTPFYHPGIQLENKERAAILFGAIAKLPVDQRTAFILHKVEGMSQAEIAEVMERSISSVESLMVRAKQKLRELLADYYEKNEK